MRDEHIDIMTTETPTAQGIIGETEPLRIEPAACEVSVALNESEFDSLEPEWNQLLKESDGTVFQTFEWLRTWWRYFGGGRELHCLVFRHHDHLIGIAPMFRQHVRILGVRMATRLRFIGTGISDYMDIIIARGYEHVVLETFARRLHSNDAGWDVFDIADVSERSPVYQRFPLLLEQQGLRVYTYQGNVCPQFVLPDTWEAFLQHIGQKMRYQLRRKKEKLKESTRLDVEVFKSEEDDIARGVEQFITLHQQRWKSLGFWSAFDDPNHRAFHFDVADKFARRGWLRLFFLKINGTPVAVSFDFNFNKRIHVYLSHAHASEAIMKQSPGFLVRCMAIERGIEEGMRIYDLLRGNEPYKYEELKCTPINNWLIRAAPCSKNGRLRFRIFIIRELFFKIPNRFRREYYEFKRFLITKKPTPAMTLQFLASKSAAVYAIGRYYISRFFRKPGELRSSDVVKASDKNE